MDQKLLEWLVSRKQIPTNWKDSNTKIQKQIKELTQSLPKSVSLPNHRDVTYYDIENIMNQLVTVANESVEKNWLGQYTSEKMRVWATIKSSYEKDRIYLGEAAQIVVQNLKYEIPSIKRSLDQFQKQINDLSKKENDFNKTANDFQSQFDTACKEMKVKGEDLNKELEALVHTDLPEQLDLLAGQTKHKNVTGAIEFYVGWVGHITKQVLSEGIAQIKANPLDDLEVLIHINKYGNEPAYLLKKRKENPNFNPEMEKAKNAEITDQKKETNLAPTSSTIDWGISLESSNTESSPFCKVGF